MKTYLVITALLVAGFCMASCGEADTPEGGGVATADMPSVKERWKSMDPGEKEAVCAQVKETPAPQGTDAGSGQIPTAGPDYKGMLNALMDAGFEQPDAAAMLPYAVNQCL